MTTSVRHKKPGGLGISQLGQSWVFHNYALWSDLGHSNSPCIHSKITPFPLPPGITTSGTLRTEGKKKKTVSATVLGLAGMLTFNMESRC